MLTDTQRRVYSAVISLSISTKRSPKYKEIAAKVGVKSLSTIHKHIKALIRKGWLTQETTHVLEVVPANLRNGSEWHHCEEGHPRIWYQVSGCPVCLKV